ncbi:acetyl-CoA decarbonylase/synthase complex subunit gamma [uncultured Methanomethylovorans sp.]|uniref:acetyl-CoA decarbonylase/synthase complex subunit gamma n=1 Tax=uncultured Methanomethylovorans sp. TaxID=183759 RepID=UPI002AA6113D|nr:acetyl-CoA decarbonylase/synthase complex subunit gamma [uncultured Methanomethylovorans sp.]
MKINSPLEAYKYLPATNCGECGEQTCMAFAAHLIDRSKKLTECKPILEEKFAKKFKELQTLLAPEIREVEIGVGERAVKIGGDDVLYRHRLTFFNQTALAYDVWDTMPENEFLERVKKIDDFKKFYVGSFLTLNMVAVRCVSKDPKKFANAVKKVIENTDMPLILCSFDPAVLKAGLEVAKDKNPLLYAANKDNWQQVADLAIEYNVPVTLFSPDDLDTLKSLAVTFAKMGTEKLVLDPGTFPTGKDLKKTFTNFLKIRRAGIEGDKDIAYPIMAVPLTAWMAQDDVVSASYWETVVASIFTIKYGDVMIMHSLEGYALLPQLHIRDTIYTDPRKPVSVQPGMNKIGDPDKDSPVLITTNFALTYYTVESDLASSKINCYLWAIDTDGLGVEAAVAGGQLTAAKIKKGIEDSGFDLKKDTTHNSIVLPGLAARLQGDLEDESGARILIGPADSGRLPGWMEKNWPPKPK